LNGRLDLSRDAQGVTVMTGSIEAECLELLVNQRTPGALPFMVAGA
jgi:hypothetical protein